MQCVLRALIALGAIGLRMMFSRRVTGSRCSSFTQPRLRQRWSSSCPSGTGPFTDSQENLWAGMYFVTHRNP